MLAHHDSRPYEIVAGEAASRATEILGGMIEQGRVSGAEVIEKVITEVPTDRIVRGSVLDFDGNIDDREPGSSDGIFVSTVENSNVISLDIHSHALQQICGRSNFPWRYAQYLRDEDRRGWGSNLLANNLNELYKRQNNRFLLRSYDDHLRGFLSDRFRRLDSRPLIEAFANACKKLDAVPVQGYATDTKVALKALLPRVFEPVPNEVLAFGVCWENSDYGNGAHSIRMFVLRLWCTNYAIADEGLRQIHLGKRLSDQISFSQKTYELDTKATASAVSDIVTSSLGSKKTEEFCEVIKRANDDKIDPKRAIAKYKKQLSKGETTEVTEVYNSPDVELLPSGNTRWRLSNAISWVAGETENVERKLELMKVAGEVIQS
jgi:hypothetical protein